MKILSFAMAAITGILVSAAQPVLGEPIHLKHAAWESPQAFLVSEVYEPWIADIVAASNGTLEIEIFAGGTLGGPAQQLQNIEGGVSDMGLIVPSQNPGRFALNDIGELPFLWTDTRVSSIAINRLVENGDLNYPGFKVLAAFLTGSYQVHSSRPVHNMDDLNGLRTRVAGPVFGSVASALGANPVGMLAGQISETISRGGLDATMLDWTILHAFRISEVTPYHLNYGLGGVIVLMGMNQEVYDGLPAEAKAAVDQYSGEGLARRWSDAVHEETSNVIKILSETQGHEIIEPSAEERAEMDLALASVVEEWGERDAEHAAVLAAFKRELEVVRAEIEANKAQ